MLDNIRKRLDTWSGVRNLPGGGDQQLETAEVAVADAEAEIAPYVPPLPVPLSRPVHRDYEFQRGSRSPVWLVNPTTTVTSVAGKPGTLQDRGTVADEGSDFPVNSIMVDNFTVAWAYWPEVGVWVPPFVSGKVFRFDGSRRMRVIFENPPGIAAPVTPTAAQSKQVCRVGFYEELLEEKPGFQVVAANQ